MSVFQKTLWDQMFKRIEGVAFSVTFWDGETRHYGLEEDGRSSPSFQFIFNQPLSLPDIMSDPVLRIGEAYMRGDLEVEGSLHELLRVAIEHEATILEGALNSSFQRVTKSLFTRDQDEQQAGVQYHYDLGNDFFRLWLDDTMSYSCAYFRTPQDSLEDAQRQKIDHVLRKLCLKPGETLLDIGCGWGGLLIRAAREYSVTGVGITLSDEQVTEANRRIREEGLADQLEVRLADFREIADRGQQFDKIASIGMFEHVGKAYIPEYFDAIERMLMPGGLSMLHTLTHPEEDPPNPWLAKYIFPWGYIPSLREVVWVLPEHDFHLLDAESLRLHYALTTERWAENFEREVPRVEAMYDAQFVRMWRLFLVGCAVSFRHSGLNVHQLLFSKGLNNTLPLTREHLYRGVLRNE